jgi:tetratricopeptide (TPR) repeat protein
MVIRGRKLACIMLGISAALLLGGCNSTTEKTQEAMSLVQQLDYDAALLLFDEAESTGENERLIARGRGIAYMGLTDYEQAIGYFLEALSMGSGFVQPVDFDLNYYLAAAYVKNGQFEEAVETYDAILGLRPGEQDAYFLRGCALLEINEYERAKADFDKVLGMDPHNYDRLIQVYEALAHHGYQTAGRGYLTSALENGGKSLDVYDSGRIYYYLGEYQKAYIALEAAKENGGAESFLYLGRAYEATGDYNYAANVYNSYLAKEGGNAEVYNQLGICELAKGEYAKALTAFQAGKQLEDSEYLQALSYNEIVAYEYLGEYEKASVLLETYLKAYPDDGQARREQGFLSTR